MGLEDRYRESPDATEQIRLREENLPEERSPKRLSVRSRENLQHLKALLFREHLLCTQGCAKLLRAIKGRGSLERIGGKACQAEGTACSRALR